jgi:transcription elongation GreA/GreB family factor
LSSSAKEAVAMSESRGSGPSGSDVATRGRLERELAELRGQRRAVAARLGGEDPEDRAVGDRGDQAVALEGLDELARLDRRITEIDHKIAGLDGPHAGSGLPEGTVVTLRFPDGDVSTYRIVALPEQLPEDEQDQVLTADSPLALALAGCRAGDTVSYQSPDGDSHAEVLAVQPG